MSSTTPFAHIRGVMGILEKRDLATWLALPVGRFSRELRIPPPIRDTLESLARALGADDVEKLLYDPKGDALAGRIWNASHRIRLSSAMEVHLHEHLLGSIPARATRSQTTPATPSSPGAVASPASRVAKSTVALPRPTAPPPLPSVPPSLSLPRPDSHPPAGLADAAGTAPAVAETPVGRELRQLVAANDAAHVLAAPVSELAARLGWQEMEYLRSLGKTTPIARLFEDPLPRWARNRRVLDVKNVEAIRTHAARWVRARVAEVARVNKLEELYRQTAVEPTHPDLVAFDEVVVRSAAAAHAGVAEALVRARPLGVAAFEAKGPRIIYSAWSQDDASPTLRPASEIPLETWRVDRLVIRPLDYALAGSPGANLRALEATRRLIRDTSAVGHRGLVEWITVPAWQRALNALGSAAITGARTTTASKVAEPLTWCLRGGREGVTFIEAFRTDKRRTDALAAKSCDWATLVRERASLGDEHDQAALDVVLQAYEDSNTYIASPSRARFIRIARALVGHPRVHVDNVRSPPVELRPCRAVLVVEPAADGTSQLRFDVGDRLISAGDLLSVAKETPNFLRVGPEIPDRPRVVHIVEVDRATTAVATALLATTSDIPPEAHAELAMRLCALDGALPVRIPEALEGEPIESSALPFVRFTPHPGDRLELAIRIRPLPGGHLLTPGEGAPRAHGNVDGAPRYVVRDLTQEEAAAQRIVGALPLDSVASVGRLTWEFASIPAALGAIEAVQSLEGVVVEWPEEKIEIRGASKAQLRVQIAAQQDWFGLRGDLEIDDARVTIAALMEAVRRGDRYVRLGPRKFAAIAEDLRERLAALTSIATPDVDRGFPRVAAPVVAEILEGVAEIDPTPVWQALLARIDDARRSDPLVPKSLRAELRPYQVDGYRWLARLSSWGAGACLADDMGLGKTVQTIALLLARAKDGPALVVAPMSVGPNWLRELERFAPTLRVRHYRGPERARAIAKLRPRDVVVTSYEIATRDIDDLAKIEFATLVLDEAQAVKNATTSRAKAMRRIRTAWRVGLTGTPIENHLGELWSLFDTLSPGLLGTWREFQARYAAPIERDGDATRRRALASLLRPFLLRRTKEAVERDLPPLTEIARTIDLAPAERALYEQERLAAIAALTKRRGPDDGRFEILAALMRLRRLACNARLRDPDSTARSAKLTAFMELVEELRETDHRALVFSQFTGHLALVREALDKARVRYLYLDGSTPSEERARRVDAFQRGEALLFLISLKAGGTGLNLTAATHVVHLDPWWNPAVEDQATDRAHRIGQTRPVTVIRFIARGTIEEAVVALHAKKRDLAEGVLSGSEGAGKLSTTELMSLIRAGEDAAEVDGEVEEGGDLREGAAALA